MSELPPDSPRLQAILPHLDKQLAEYETAVIYLRLQPRAVLAALEHGEDCLHSSIGRRGR
ncbi:hypothetical protein ACWDSD_28405 [Streptomyces spiralis]